MKHDKIRHCLEQLRVHKDAEPCPLSLWKSSLNLQHKTLTKSLKQCGDTLAVRGTMASTNGSYILVGSTLMLVSRTLTVWPKESMCFLGASENTQVLPISKPAGPQRSPSIAFAWSNVICIVREFSSHPDHTNHSKHFHKRHDKSTCYCRVFSSSCVNKEQSTFHPCKNIQISLSECWHRQTFRGQLQLHISPLTCTAAFF